MNTKFSDLTVTLVPRRAALVAGFDNQLEVLVRVQAPEAPEGAAKKRPPYGIGLVIDRSGSMSGQPIEEARRCAAYVVDQLRADDWVSVVEFDNRVKLAAAAQPKGDGRLLMRAIEDICAGGNTNLHGGWHAGAEDLAKSVLEAGLKRVILLSDGCANEGITETSEIADQCREMAKAGVTTSTYGLGRSFNEELMVAMADAGQGNHYYGETAEDLMEPFRAEFDLLSNLCLKGLKLKATGCSGGSVEMLNQLTGNAEEGWLLPDLAWGSEAWAVLRVRIPKGAVPSEGIATDCLNVDLSATDLDGSVHLFGSLPLSLSAINAAAYAAVAEDSLVVRRLSEIEAGNLLRSMRDAANRGDWPEVDRILKAAEEKYADNEWVAGVLVSIRAVAATRSRERLMKDSMYASKSFSKRLTSKGESLDFSCEIEAPSYLPRKRAPGKEEFGKK